MIYDGINLEHKYPGLIIELNRDVKPPMRLVDITHINGRSGDIVADENAYSDAELEYSAYLRVFNEFDRTDGLSRLITDLTKGKKCELIDKRDNGRIINAILTGYSHKRKGIWPTLAEHLQLTFTCDPYSRSGTTYKIPLNSSADVVRNLGHRRAHFVLKGKITSATNRLTISIPDANEQLVLINAFRTGDIFEVDSEKHFVTVNGYNAMKFVSILTDFFDLPKGASHFNCENWTGTIEYKEMYLIG